MVKQKLTEQLAVRMTDAQRVYLKEQLAVAKHDPLLNDLNLNESDMLRSLVEHARRNKLSIPSLIREAVE